MRILLISDVHANIQALEAVLKDAGKVDAVWCAGDLVDYGAFPHQVVQWFIHHDVQCVSGNHDRHLLNIWASGETEEVRGTGRYKWVHDNCDHMTEEDIRYLKSLPMHLHLMADGIDYLLQHQMGEGPLAYQMPESVESYEQFWQAHAPETCRRPERRMIFGHTHRRCVHCLDDHLLWLNPGSVSYRRPDDHDKRAHYMTIEDGRIAFHAVPYDREPSLRRVMDYVRSGHMLVTDLQDTLFFFGNAATTRDPIEGYRQ